MGRSSSDVVPKECVILGLDPGLRNLGYCIARADMRPIELGHFETKKLSAKTDTYAADDDYRRAQELGAFLRDLCFERHKVRLVVAERASYPRSASSAAKIALCWGVIAEVFRGVGVPLIQISPQHVRNAVSTAKASKEQMWEDLLSKVPKEHRELLEAQILPIPKTKQEHPKDAYCTLFAARKSPYLQIFSAVQ